MISGRISDIGTRKSSFNHSKSLLPQEKEHFHSTEIQNVLREQTASTTLPNARPSDGSGTSDGLSDTNCTPKDIIKGGSLPHMKTVEGNSKLIIGRSSTTGPSDSLPDENWMRRSGGGCFHDAKIYCCIPDPEMDTDTDMDANTEVDTDLDTNTDCDSDCDSDWEKHWLPLTAVDW
ncbi:hypothetical protein BZA77DRAFT_291878 [Pyronema omphalodes]|nr:hypothetical protein BZA77DRAFT_296893 [Pyronema omphalodes]KAI5817949.1 hypothetical protein BZA77DRAFT_291878 [Pyronema omphalodes]